MKYGWLIALPLLLIASPREAVINGYQDQRYRATCRLGLKHYRNYMRDEEFQAAFGFSCLLSDNYNAMVLAANFLRATPKSRTRASYLSTIYLQKKLLWHALWDGIDLAGVTMPRTDHFLSKIFEAYRDKKYTKKGERYMMEIDNIHYELWLDREREGGMIMIEETSGATTRRHAIW